MAGLRDATVFTGAACDVGAMDVITVELVRDVGATLLFDANTSSDVVGEERSVVRAEMLPDGAFAASREGEVLLFRPRPRRSDLLEVLARLAPDFCPAVSFDWSPAPPEAPLRRNIRPKKPMLLVLRQFGMERVLCVVCG